MDGSSSVDTTRETVRDYYGKELTGSSDLKTTACCAIDAIPHHMRDLIDAVHPDVRDRFYGCGSPIAPLLEGRRVLDLGCGTGRDAYIMSQLVGEQGEVIGVDMTDEQLAVARRHQDWHRERFGHAKSNIRFEKGFIEDLRSVGLEDNSVDVVTSNCVINLASDKRRVFEEIFRVLKPGGELYFADVYADRRVPADLKSDPVLLGECLGGALYHEDFRRMLADIGCPDFRVTASNPIDLIDPALKDRAGMINFSSVTVRAFKVPLEDRCENFGQVAWYEGTIPHHRHEWALDDHHLFRTGVPMPICGNTAAMLQETRYADHFRIVGERTTHYGLFDCTPSVSAEEKPAGACC